VPVIASRNGSVPEVVENRVTGFIDDDLDALVAAVPEVATLDRRQCRERVETLFSVERMTNDYELVYLDLANNDAGAKAERTALAEGDLAEPNISAKSFYYVS